MIDGLRECVCGCCCCWRFIFSRRASTLTTEYSMNEPNTKTRQVAIQTSIALVKDTAGMLRRCTELCVVIVNIVRIPSEMRAGTDSRSIQKDTSPRRSELQWSRARSSPQCVTAVEPQIQKDTQESRTIRMLGRNVDNT